LLDRARGDAAPAAVLTLAAPAVVIALDAGQPILVAGALAALGLAELDRRPRLAGVLTALAAAIKPQALLMAPVALAACGALEAALAAGLAFAALGAASLALYGPGAWGAWLASLPTFQGAIARTPHLGAAVITPAWAARELGLGGAAAAACTAAFAVAGASLVWRTFRRGGEAAPRLAALASASLMAAPYAMSYDGALVAPAAAALAISGLERRRPLQLALALGSTLLITAPYLGLVGLLGFAALAAVSADERVGAPEARQLGPQRQDLGRRRHRRKVDAEPLGRVAVEEGHRPGGADPG